MMAKDSVWQELYVFKEMKTQLTKKAKEYCKELLKASRCNDFQFHNWKHTRDVVRNAIFIGKNEGVSNDTLEELIIAAYFHDLGNIKSIDGHEILSCYYAKEFLLSESFPEKRIKNAVNIIKATQMPQQPVTIAQKVICDADLAHLGKKNFISKNKHLRKEWHEQCDMTFTDEQWLVMNVKFLKEHTFHTGFAQKHYNEQKIENLVILERAVAAQKFTTLSRASSASL